MKMKCLLSLAILFCCIQFTWAQTIYVDAAKGLDQNSGESQAPLKSLPAAIQKANSFTGMGSITVQLKPGLYVLEDKVVINPVRITNDTTQIIIEASILPDEPNWMPEQMPIIQSVSANNSDTQFTHATALLVAGEHVLIRGLKFIGNPNPDVVYYYPISRENPALKGLEISQCYFIAEQNSATIQGAIWAHGEKLAIHHNVFKGCRNAILAFQNIKACSIHHNLIYDAYEAAMWIGANPGDFAFNHNVIDRCEYFWVKGAEEIPDHLLQNSLINTEHFAGQWDREKGGLVAIENHHFKEKNIIKKGEVMYIERLEPKFPQNYLHLKPESSGYALNAGIFMKD